MVLSELYLQQGPWVARSLWSIVPASILESLSIALLLGLGIGLLCGDLARTLSAFMRGDPAVTIFWAIVGVLGVMTFVPTERIIHIIVPWVIYGRNAFKVWGVGDPREYNFLVLRLSSANRVVVLIIAKGVFIGLGAAGRRASSEPFRRENPNHNGATNEGATRRPSKGDETLV